MRLYAIETEIASPWIVHVIAEHAADADAVAGELAASDSWLWSLEELLAIPGGQEAIERWWSVQDDAYLRYKVRK